MHDGLAINSHKQVVELRNMGHDVTVVSTRDTDAANGVPHAFTASPLAMWRTFRYLRSAKPEVIHVQYVIAAYGLLSLPLWIMLVMLRRQSRIVATYHEVKRETKLLGPVGRIYYQFISRIAHHITVHTAEAVSILTNACKIAPSKVTHINIPLFVEKQSAQDVEKVRSKFKLGDAPVVLFFGFIHIDKGIDHLVRAFAIAKKAGNLHGAKLVIAGSVRKREGIFKLFEKKDVNYEAEIHQLVADLKLKKDVIFTPYVPDDEVAAWFSHASIVALPYTNLEQSAVLSLALGNRRPMIVSNLGGLGETMSGTDALVPPADEDALAAKLGYFLNDPMQGQKLVKQYKRICDERTIQVIAEDIVAVYKKVRA